MLGKVDRIPLGDEHIHYYTGEPAQCVGGTNQINVEISNTDEWLTYGSNYV